MPEPPAEAEPSENGKAPEPGGVFSNFAVRTYRRKGKKAKARQGVPVQAIDARLRQLTGGWPRRVGNLLFAEGPGRKPLWLETPPQLFAWVARHLPGKAEVNGLVWGASPDMVSEGRFHAYLTQTAEDY